MKVAAVDVRDAATVILVSDRPDLHVLMLERTSRAVFSPGATVFPGDIAFKLHDTHGFPIELTEEIVSESGLKVDRNTFDQAMKAHNINPEKLNPAIS